MAKTEYKTTAFSAKFDRQKKLQLVDPEPPAGDNWTMINFQPIQHPEPTQNYFIAVWERNTDE